MSRFAIIDPKASDLPVSAPDDLRIRASEMLPATMPAIAAAGQHATNAPASATYAIGSIRDREFAASLVLIMGTRPTPQGPPTDRVRRRARCH